MTASTFRIGGDRAVGRLGLGAMRLPTGPSDREASVAVLRRAVELGVTLVDTAHMYGWGANEELIAEALHPYPDDLLVATKVGISQPAPGAWAVDGRPAALRDGVRQALRRLRVERLELLQLHRIDPEVPLDEQLGALREMQVEGTVARIGLSEVTVDELAAARRAVDVVSVQNRYNVLDREHDAVLDACTSAGIAFLPWRPVASGPALDAVAAELGATAAQVSLAWLLHRSPVVLPIPGTTTLAHLAENVAAAEQELSADQLRRLDAPA